MSSRKFPASLQQGIARLISGFSIFMRSVWTAKELRFARPLSAPRLAAFYQVPNACKQAAFLRVAGADSGRQDSMRLSRTQHGRQFPIFKSHHVEALNLNLQTVSLR